MNCKINNFEDVAIQAAVHNVTNAGDGWGFRKIILWATERRLKRILEAFAERIRCPEASRSSQPNGNLEEAPPIPGSHNLPTGSVVSPSTPDFQISCTKITKNRYNVPI